MPSSFLIVDADRNFREALAIALRLDGHEVQAADSSDDGLARLCRGGIRCCVVDAHLAGADELLAAAASAGVRVVVTGPYPELLAFAAQRHPGAEPLPKPFGPAALVDQVRGAA
jgi:DNA-binding NtrC family response regulator